MDVKDATSVEIIRSWMFVPGNQSKFLRKAQDSTADVVVYDLEDSVPPNEKARARQLVAESLDKSPDAPPAERQARRFLSFVRVSQLEPGGISADLQAVLRPGLDGIVLPKVEVAQQVREVDQLLADLERGAGLEPGRVQVVATIETTGGLVSAPAIAAAGTRLRGLLFGAEDFRADLGVLDFADATSDAMTYARSAVAIAAASSGLAAIDRVVVDFRNTELLIQDCQQARRLGYRGKAVIHPAQIEPVNEQFTPRPEEVRKARHVVDEYTAAIERGVGSISVDGKMVDLAVVEKARRIVEFADALGSRELGSRQ